MPVLDVTHWDIAAFIILMGIGFLFGFITGRFYHLLNRFTKALEKRGRKK